MLIRSENYGEELFAYAKINLYLKIIGKLADNYHELDSMVVFCRLCDEISIDKMLGEKDEIIINGEFSRKLTKKTEIENNSVLRSIVLFREKFAIKDYFRITLKKNIPHGYGLGGGSADAATILNYLAKKYNKKHEEIEDISLKIGSDVPVCLTNRAMIIRGKGEILQKPPQKIQKTLSGLSILLVFPAESLITKDIYEAFNENFSDCTKPEEINDIKNIGNDLQKTAIKKLPIIGDICDFLERRPSALISGMSGSGSACFLICKHQAEMMKISELVKKQFPQCKIRISEII